MLNISKLVHVSTRSAFSSRSPNWSCNLSTRFYGVSLRITDIYRCVIIAVVVSLTLGAIPLTNAQGKRFQYVPADITAFTTWEKWIDNPKILFVPVAFVGKHSPKHAKGGIADNSCQFVISDHTSNIQIFDLNYVKATNQIGGHFVEVVFPHVSNMLLKTSNLENSPAPSTAPLLLLGKLPLQLLQLQEIRPKSPGVWDLFAIGQGSQTRNAEVDADFQASLRKGQPHFIEAESNKVFPTWQLGYCHRGGDTLETSAPVNVKSANAGDAQIAIGSIPLERASGVLSGLLASLLLECRILRSLVPEVDVSSLEMPKRLLGRDARDLVEPFGFRLPFQFGEHSGRFVVPNASVLFEPSISTDAQKTIEDEPTGTENPRKALGLLFCRVNPVCVSHLHNTIVSCVNSEVKQK